MNSLVSADPYASHLPVLEMVLALVRPKKVLELGAGDYSTRAFLACPTVERLLSVETDHEWLNRIQDERLTMRFADDTVAALPRDLTHFDLVFVDNADNATDRERAIRAVLEQDHPVTLIHDAENAEYAAAIAESTEDYMILGAQPPWTAVCW